MLPAALIPALDHWLIDAAIQLIGDVFAAFATIVVVTIYSHFNSEQA